MDDPLLPASDGDVGEPVVLVVQHRRHRFPGRRREVKALYDDTEYAAVAAAARRAGLTPGGYVAVAALNAAGASPGPNSTRAQPPAVGDRVLLAELLEARAGLRRYAVNLNQAVIALHQGGGAPVWMRQAVSGCDRAVRRLDTVTSRLADRLGAR